MDQAFLFAEDTAIEAEDSYPYRANDGDCLMSADKGKVKLLSFVDIARNHPE